MHTLLPKIRAEIGPFRSERLSAREFIKICNNPIERAFSDKKIIEERLASGTFVLVSSKSSHCRAWNCLPRVLSGRPNIESDFRFNLKDLSRQSYSKFSPAETLNLTFTQQIEPDQYYHVTCMEQIFIDLTPLVCKGQLNMEERINRLNSRCYSEDRFQAIKDWFYYAGRTYDVQSYENHNKACYEWDVISSSIAIDYQVKNHVGKCSDCEQCESTPLEPCKGDYFPNTPQPCLLSDVLASVAGIAHIDGLNRRT